MLCYSYEGSRQVTFKTSGLVSFSASVGESSEQTIFTVHNTQKHTHTLLPSVLVTASFSIHIRWEDI